jgi:hypothetical protein
MWRKISFVYALIPGLAIFAMTTNGQSKPKPPSFVLKVISVGWSPEVWSGIDEADQGFDGVVVRSTATRFSVGQHLHVEVPVVSGDPLMSTKPHFDESKVASGKLLWIKATKGCVEFEGADVIKAYCIRPVRK